MTDSVVYMLRITPSGRSTAFKCAGCEQAITVERGQAYYVDPHGLAPANNYCAECVR